MTQLSILVVEDDPAIAIDIALTLEANDYTVFGPTHRADRALEYLRREHVDLALLDINLEGETTGIDLAHQINQQFGIPFIFLTSYSDQATVASAAETYPATFLVKPFKQEDLAPAIEIAMAGATRKSRGYVPALTLINKGLVHGLTRTEYEIMLELDKGCSVVDIADRRHNSENTIKTHVKNIYAKLDVHNKVELLNFLGRFR